MLSRSRRATLSPSSTENSTSLKSVYADILRNSRRSRMSMNRLAFIFSSNSFAQAFRRANALKQFTHWRERKVGQIRDLKAQAR